MVICLRTTVHELAPLKRPALSEEPAIHPTTHIREAKLGAWGDYSYVENDCSVVYTAIGKFCSMAAHTRINPGNSPAGAVGAAPLHLPQQELSAGDRNFAVAIGVPGSPRPSSA